MVDILQYDKKIEKKIRLFLGQIWTTLICI